MARLQRLRRQEWLSVSCEERVRRRAVADARYERWYEQASPEMRGLAEMSRDMSSSMRRQSYSLMMAFHDKRPRLLPCEACEEESCPNATWTRR